MEASSRHGELSSVGCTSWGTWASVCGTEAAACWETGAAGRECFESFCLTEHKLFGQGVCIFCFYASLEKVLLA